MNIFFQQENQYSNFSLEHALAMLFFIVICCFLVRSHRSSSQNIKKRTAIILSFIPLLALLVRMILDASIRELTLADDLPLHLCRILSIFAPMILLFDRDQVSKVFYYLVLAGTVNAMITADIEFGFPHYAFLLYWVYHGFLVVFAIFNIVTFRLHLGIKEGILSFIVANLYFIILHQINIQLDANYMYSRSKPASASIMDLLGEWPLYIFWLELIAILMILIVHLIMGRLIVKAPKKAD